MIDMIEHFRINSKPSRSLVRPINAGLSPAGLRSSSLLIAVLLFALTGTLHAGSEKPADEPAIPLLKNLGNHRYPITTRIPSARDYFNQGLILTYGFNHAEAAKSFKEAAKHDPKCAMCYWGQALVLGPNINAPMDEKSVAEAYAAVRMAVSLSAATKANEKALINALAQRYSKEVLEDRSSLDTAYADAMRKVSKRFPNDAVIAALFAESLMDLHPWNFWTKEGQAQPWTAEIIATLERSIELDVNNPLANHLYIHALEASPHPEKALPSAKRLPALVPGSGHLVHMPAHIYIRIGHYREAAQANKAAVKIDHDYLSHSHTESIYTKAYVPHNFHFLWAAAIKSGQSALAMQAAKDTAAKVDRELMRDPAFSGTLQHFSLVPLYTRALFGKWDEILDEPEPAADLIYVRGVRHYARGLAFTRKKQIENANRELEALRAIMRNPTTAKVKVFELNSALQILEIAEAMLTGEIAAAQKDYPTAIKELEKAVELEDGLNYTEPKDWYLPPRQVLGAILLEAGDPVRAEKVFRKDLDYHPQNGWSLFGLVQSLKAQGKALDARKAQSAYKKAWQDADIELAASRF